MKIHFTKSHKKIYDGIILLLFGESTRLLDLFFQINLPILRYFLFTLAFYNLISGIISTRSSSIKNKKTVTILIKFIFFTCIIALVVRGLPLVFSSEQNFLYLKLFFTGQPLLYLMPLILISVPNEALIKKLFILTYKLTVIYILIIAPYTFYLGVNYDTRYFVESTIYFFVAQSGILVLLSPYNSKRVYFISYLSFFLALIINIILSRRTSVVFYSGIIFVSFLQIIFTKSSISNTRKLITSILVLLSCIILYIFITLNSAKSNKLIERYKTGFDNRERLITELYDDFDRNPSDWIWGRGMNGTFHSLQGYLPNNQRDVIENGYLQIILKGGIIYLIFTILIFILAAYNGMFKSRNLLCKSFSIIILFQCIEMIGFGLPSLTLKYFIIWMGVACCLHKPLLNKSDFEIRRLVQVI